MRLASLVAIRKEKPHNTCLTLHSLCLSLRSSLIAASAQPAPQASTRTAPTTRRATPASQGRSLLPHLLRGIRLALSAELVSTALRTVLDLAVTALAEPSITTVLPPLSTPERRAARAVPLMSSRTQLARPVVSYVALTVVAILRASLGRRSVPRAKLAPSKGLLSVTSAPREGTATQTPASYAKTASVDATELPRAWVR